jgi:UDP-glucose 4-epimerase
MKILVTGGAGYIGSALVEKLISLGHEVKVIDDLSNGFIENINQKAEYLNGSILNDELLSRAVKDVEAVFHLAAKIRVEEGEVKPNLYRQVNVDGTLNLLKLCNSFGVKKFIFASTAAVYGDPSDYPVSEESQTKPVNVYGRTKLEIDEYLSKSAKSLGISAISFRFFNVGGAVQNSKQEWLKIKHEGATHLIPSILRSTELSPLLIYGNDWPTSDGTPVRDFVHLSDLIDALVGSLNCLENPGHEIINLGTAKGSTVLEVIQAAEVALKREINYKFAPRRAGDSFALVTSSGKARELLNWNPLRNLINILEDANSELNTNRKVL